MDDAPHNADLLFHVRVFIGIVTGLSVTRLLAGLARFIQHPAREHIYPIHLGWALFLLLSVIHFWWFEFGLSRITVWTFEIYIFVIGYAVLFFLACVVLFPDKMEEYSGFKAYFHSRQKWFYGLLAALFLVDMIDSAAKGMTHFQSLGVLYPVRQSVLAALAVIAIFVRDWRYHAAFLALAFVAEVVWIVGQFSVMN